MRIGRDSSTSRFVSCDLSVTVSYATLVRWVFRWRMWAFRLKEIIQWCRNLLLSMTLHNWLLNIAVAAYLGSVWWQDSRLLA